MLTAKGYKPVLNITDNQATTPIKTFMESQQGKVQFIEPNNHRVNAAKRAIQTFKNHFISGLCTTSRINPDISAFEQLHGAKFDWNAHPIAPPGTRAVIHSSPLTHTSLLQAISRSLPMQSFLHTRNKSHAHFGNI
jgi:hypothetical protein